jgi:dTDP-glucose 4,6-dehydratase
MNILVTGGAGFIGSNFVNQLFSDSYNLSFNDVFVLDSLTYAGSLSNIEEKVRENNHFHFIRDSINNSQIVRELVEQVDLVINFAAESHVDKSIEDPELFVKTNVLGVTNILNALVRKGSGRLVQVSTDEVYGSIETGSWDENFPVSPNSPYSASKASADLLCQAFHRTFGVDVVITRCSNNFGPRQYPEKLIPLAIKKLMSGSNVPIYGDGQQKREWIHVDDHCSGIALVSQLGKAGEIYNIGSSLELKNVDLISVIIAEMGLKNDRIDFVKDRLGHDLRYSVNYNKIHSELNYAPKIDFGTGLKETVAWYVNHFSSEE